MFKVNKIKEDMRNFKRWIGRKNLKKIERNKEKEVSEGFLK